MFTKIRQDFANDISVLNTGKKKEPWSDEQKQAHSIRLTGVPKSAETRERMKGPKSDYQLRGLKAHSESRIGTTHSEETKIKMRKPKREGTSAVYSEISKGKVAAYDIELDKIVRVTTEEFYKMKNIKYVGINSKLRTKNG